MHIGRRLEAAAFGTSHVMCCLLGGEHTATYSNAPIIGGDLPLPVTQWAGRDAQQHP